MLHPGSPRHPPNAESAGRLTPSGAGPDEGITGGDARESYDAGPGRRTSRQASHRYSGKGSGHGREPTASRKTGKGLKPKTRLTDPPKISLVASDRFTSFFNPRHARGQVGFIWIWGGGGIPVGRA